MKLQEQWAINIKPLGAMFKFRLSYESGTMEYLYGDNYLPIWGPVSTTETRLICNKDDTNNWTKKIKYNNSDQEQKMFYFNKCYRVNVFHHNVNISKINCLCHCYDCTAEIIVINNYLKLFKDKIFISDIVKNIKQINDIIKRNLCSDNLNKEYKVEHFKERYKNISDEDYKKYEESI